LGPKQRLCCHPHSTDCTHYSVGTRTGTLLMGSREGSGALIDKSIILLYSKLMNRTFFCTVYTYCVLVFLRRLNCTLGSVGGSLPSPHDFSFSNISFMVADLCFTLMRSRIRIRIKMKGRTRIRLLPFPLDSMALERRW
jgi:hypothetical protein